MRNGTLNSKRGATLAELLVGMAVGVIVLAVVSQFFAGDSRKMADVRAAENMQFFEVSSRLQLAQADATEKLAEVTSDSILKQCLTSPCSPGCENINDWQPTEWGEVPMGERKIAGEQMATGGAFTLPDWKLCQAANDYDLKCPARARAEWRSGPGRTIDLRLTLEIPAAKLRRVVHRLLPMPDIESDPRCSKHRGVYCKDTSSYLLDVDFAQSRAVCAGTDVEENYQ